MLSLFPVLPFKLTSLILIVWFLTAVLSSVYNLKSSFPWRKALLVSSPFILACLGYFLLDDSSRSLKAIERNLPFLIIPTGIFLNSSVLNFKTLSRWMIVFSVVVLFTALKGHLLTVDYIFDYVKGKQWEGRVWELFNEPSFHHHYRIKYAKFSGIHPTYSGIFIAISLLFLNQLFIQGWRKFTTTKRIGAVLVNLIAMFCLAMVTARTPVLALLFTSIIQFGKTLGLKKSLVIIPITIVTLLASLYLLVPSFKQKINEIEVKSIQVPTEENNNSFNIRKGILSCSIEVLKGSWLTGIGAGGSYMALNECYNGLEFETYKKEKFNTHNQYLDYWISYGLVGFTLLVLLLLSTAKFSFKQGVTVGWLIVLVFTITMLTENVLSRYYGVLPFAFIMSFINLKIKELEIG